MLEFQGPPSLISQIPLCKVHQDLERGRREFLKMRIVGLGLSQETFLAVSEDPKGHDSQRQIKTRKEPWGGAQGPSGVHLGWDEGCVQCSDVDPKSY